MTYSPMVAPPTDRNTLLTLHRALCAGCGLFALVTLGMYFTGTVPLHPDLPAELQWIGLLLGGALVPVAFAVLRSLLVRVGEDFEVGALGRRVRAAGIMHWAVLEGGVLINLVLFLLTGSWVSFATALAILLVMVLRAPKEELYARWLTGRP